MAGDYLTSGAIHFTGLGNGTDFDSIIQAMVKAQSFHKNRLESWKADWEDKQTAFQDLNTTLLSLKTHMQSMDKPSEFFVKNVTSTDEDVLTATADSDAAEGNHLILVNQLAQNKIQTNSTGYADPTTVINSTGSDQTIVLNYNGKAAVTITIPDGTTLAGALNMINKDADNPGVRASIVSDGSSSYLQMRGMDMGSGATLSLAGSTLSGYDDTGGNWDVNQANQNAQIRVDGWPISTWIESDTNTITDAVEGVSFSLKSIPFGQSNASITLSIANDNSAIKENVRGFVDKINEVRSELINLTKFDENMERGALLQGNYGLQLISTKLKDVTSQKGVGFDYDDDVISTLSQIGIMTDAEEGSATRGLLMFDEEIFDEAMKTDPDAVSSFFSAYFSGDTNSSDFTYDSHISGVTKAGTYAVEYTVDGSGTITSATIGGQTASIIGSQMTGPSGTDMAGLVINAVNLSAGTYTGEVRLKLGKAGQMVETLDEITSTVDGPLHILEDNYQDIIDDIDKKIDYETDRITRMERMTRSRFARLESTLSYYDSMMKSLDSQISSLSSK
ncbi:flagellar filament capping protein FliD [Desulfovibrio ferrophilus]|uniref:Flagellar hook-associated protein 2 n=1 Tax=Desulfovibrio ferrophilus TaxID=241368 RepID=A0A2Z6AZE5_9BACT|nr:flagellar filament capping protein FliD [Desulfovibrio ferrophilus]BBD08637.1 flagellar hook-associated 2 domain protein [Desulfovibrio ferrophilus]